MATAPTLRQKAGIVVSSRLLTSLIDLSTGVLLLRLLSKSDFAVMSFVLLVYTSALYLCTLGFPDSVFYFFERIERGAQRAFAFRTAGLVGAAALVAAAILVALPPALPHLLTNWTSDQVALAQRYLPLVALVAVLEIPTWPVNNLMLAMDRAADAAWYQVVTSLMTFSALVGPVVLGLGLDAIVWGLVAYAVLRFALSLGWMLTVLPPTQSSIPSGLLREQLAFALPLGFNGLASRLNKQQDRYIVSALLPAERLAEYSAGAIELPLVTVIPNALGSVLISRFVRFHMDGNRAELIRLWYRAIEKTTLLVVPVGVLFIAAARDFVPLLAGDQYLSAVLPFQLFTLVVLHRVTSYGTMLQAFGDTRSILRITLALLTVNVALSIPLTLAFGIVGTALGTVLANAFSWYLGLRAIGMHMGLPARRVLPFPFYLRTLAAASLAGAITYVFRSALVGDDFAAGFVVSLLIFVPLFALFGTLVRVIGAEEWALIRRVLRLG